jgi:hypothetical protein
MNLKARLARVEALLHAGRRYPALLVVPVGMPVDVPPGGLALLVHEAWCDVPGHEGVCASPPSGEDS